MSKKYLAYILLICTTLIWSINFIIGKFAYLFEVPPLSLNFLRWALVWILLFPFTYKEIFLNIKLIIFSSEAWKSGDKNNVLLCGQLNDPILEDIGTFEPEYYILLDYTGDHYKLITYKYHRMFQFSEIPYAIKLDIAKVYK